MGWIGDVVVIGLVDEDQRLRHRAANGRDGVLYRGGRMDRRRWVVRIAQIHHARAAGFGSHGVEIESQLCTDGDLAARIAELVRLRHGRAVREIGGDDVFVAAREDPHGVSEDLARARADDDLLRVGVETLRERLGELASPRYAVEGIAAGLIERGQDRFERPWAGPSGFSFLLMRMASGFAGSGGAPSASASSCPRAAIMLASAVRGPPNRARLSTPQEPPTVGLYQHSAFSIQFRGSVLSVSRR